MMDIRNMTERELIDEAFKSPRMIETDYLVRKLAHELALSEGVDELEEILAEEELNDANLLQVEMNNLRNDYQLEDFIDSQFWAEWEEKNRSDMALKDPERYSRCEEAAVYGTEGSTHREIIMDWERAIHAARRAGEFGPFTEWVLDREIEACFRWFEREGRLDEQGA